MARRQHDSRIVNKVEDLGVSDPAALAMRDRGVRHDGCEEDVDLLACFCRLCGLPQIEVAFLGCYFLLVELPVLVDRDGLAFVDEGFDVRYVGFAAGLDVSANVFASICGVVLVLFDVSDFDGARVVKCLPHHDVDALLVQAAWCPVHELMTSLF